MTTMDQSGQSMPSEAEPLEGSQQTHTPTTWVIRAGQQGEQYDYNIEHGLAGVHFGQFLDLRTLSSRDELKNAMRSHDRDAGNRTISNRAGQLWRIRTDVRVGDLVVMPHKTEPHAALGTVTREYTYVGDDPDSEWPHVVSVDWRRPKLPWTAIKEDLRSSLNAQQSIFQINRHDGSWRFQQLLETGQDPGARVDLAALVEQFRNKSGYPNETHEEQKRLREYWAEEKLAPEAIEHMTYEDLAAFVSFPVGQEKAAYVRPGSRIPQWINNLDELQCDRLLDNIHDLCWGEDDLAARIDRLVDGTGGSRKDTGTKGFAGGSVSAALAICLPDRFLPVHGQEGVWGRKHMLRELGLPEPRGSTYGQQVVDANDRLREHLAPYFDNDLLAIAAFLYWLRELDDGYGPRPGNGPASDLSVLVARFRDESGYPTEADREQERLREEWAQKLSRESIRRLSRSDFYRIAAHGNRGNHKYVYTGDSSTNRWITEMSEQRYTNMLKLLKYLCWGDDDIAHRIEEISNELSGTIPSKCLAICHPDRFLPIGVLDGNPGTLQMLERLGLPKPSGETYGEWCVEANDRLREHVARYFDDDPIAIAAFLYWLMKQDKIERTEGDHTPDVVRLAEELLVDAEFLKDIVSLLRDKGQVILYGPPGTGKTYLARELAKELAPDESCRALVQFHPSTSYEDFFEGYRPAGTGDDGGVRYKLTPGPLKRMAKRASKSRDEQHVMIIDEINRGNLPRVLGELLFLLEYRDESVQTLYRPEEPFSLPDNLWFIGTMNTADRSIALVDAALRRRFHFVPFFPDSGPMEGLLGRWLDHKGEPDWVGRLVDAVNDELKAELGGSHLLLGPSHFMKEYGSWPHEQRERLRRIWEYNIEPFIEDQFFGAPEQIDRFRFDAVVRRNGPAAESDIDAGDDGDDPESTDGSQGEHAAADGEAATESGSAQPEDER